MKKRILGASNLSVSEIGLGCWQLGGDFGPISEKQGGEILEAAVDKGITFFDTADVYGAGKSEAVIGKVLRDAPKEIKVATKYGRGPGVYPNGYSLESLRDAVRYAQDRLQRHSIDLLQLHCIPKSVLEQGEIFDWLRQIKKEGHISAFGASIETLEEAQICLQQEGLASLQIIFNLLRQRPKHALFDEAKNKNVGIIVRLPLASGVLSGKLAADTRFDPSDHRNYNKNGEAFSVGETFSGIEFTKALALVDEMKGDMPKGMNMAEFAQRWILDHDAVTTIITGASRVEQVKRNAKVSEIETLDEALHEKLYRWYVEQVEKHIRCDI